MRNAALLTLFLAMLAMAAAYLLALLVQPAPPVAAWLFAAGLVASIMAVHVLGAARRGRRLGRLAAVFVCCFIVLAAGFAFVLAVPDAQGGARLWLGLPLGAAVVVYVIGVVPLLVLPLAYALTFDDDDEVRP